jgi:hypothetical protein
MLRRDLFREILEAMYVHGYRPTNVWVQQATALTVPQCYIVTQIDEVLTIVLTAQLQLQQHRSLQTPRPHGHM